MAGKTKATTATAQKQEPENKPQNKTTETKAAASKASVSTAPRKVSSDTMVPCKNAVCGNLIYRSTSPSGAYYAWGEFGDVQMIPVFELEFMRNTQRAFFEKNWIFIDDEDILKHLGVDKHYKTVMDVCDIDELYRKPPEEIKNDLAVLSDSIKDTVKSRAMELIKEGRLDSISRIKALEEALDCALL